MTPLEIENMSPAPGTGRQSAVVDDARPLDDGDTEVISRDPRDPTANTQYRERLQSVISRMLRCGSLHRETVLVHEVSEGQTVWRGEVEVFELAGHAKSKRCYAWSYPTIKSDMTGNTVRTTVILEIPPVISAQTAVRAALASARRQH